MRKIRVPHVLSLFANCYFNVLLDWIIRISSCSTDLENLDKASLYLDQGLKTCTNWTKIHFLWQVSPKNDNFAPNLCKNAILFPHEKTSNMNNFYYHDCTMISACQFLEFSMIFLNICFKTLKSNFKKWLITFLIILLLYYWMTKYQIYTRKYKASKKKFY